MRGLRSAVAGLLLPFCAACGTTSPPDAVGAADSSGAGKTASAGPDAGREGGAASEDASAGGFDDATVPDSGSPPDASTTASDDASTGTGATGDGAPGDDGGTDAGAGMDAGADASTPPDAAAEASCTTPHSSKDLPGWVGDWMPGEYPPGDITAQSYLTIDNVPGQQGNSRQYKVHVPPGYDPGTPMPLLFCIHGLGQNAVMFCTDTGVDWHTKPDQEGFLLVMPNGYQSSWNAGTCCGAAQSAGLDDVALMRAIFTEVKKHVNVDLGRVYSTGLSNGAYMSYRLACEASDIFVAVAPSAGAIGTAAIGGGTSLTSDLASCAPTNKVSVLDIHGTADPLIPYSTQAPTMALASGFDGCSSATASAAVPSSGGDTTCVSYAGCATCPNVEVTACTIQGGGHCWFGSSDCGTGGGAIGTAVVGANSNFMKNTDAVWAFLSRLSR
jgi:polyhydroxybutyrate depolymerase